MECGFEYAIRRITDHRQRYRPGLREIHWIFDGDFVRDRVGVFPCEPLHHMRIRALRNSPDAARGPARGDPAFAVEVRRVDNECVAFPMAHRVTIPESNRRWRMRTAVDWDDTGVLNHFGKNGDIAGRLDNLVGVVVSGRDHSARPSARDERIQYAHAFPG